MQVYIRIEGQCVEATLHQHTVKRTGASSVAVATLLNGHLVQVKRQTPKHAWSFVKLFTNN